MVRTRIIWTSSSASYVPLVGGCFDCLETLKSDSTEALHAACIISSFEQSVQPHSPLFPHSHQPPSQHNSFVLSYVTPSSGVPCAQGLTMARTSNGNGSGFSCLRDRRFWRRIKKGDGAAEIRPLRAASGGNAEALGTGGVFREGTGRNSNGESNMGFEVSFGFRKTCSVEVLTHELGR